MSEPKQIEIIKLGEFLRNVSNGDYGLPLIQRGSVWQNEQILDLWDSLLKGMPIGSFMTCEIKDDNYKSIAENESKPKTGLFDGQQRTLSMLLGWREDMPKKIWVDLLDKPQDGHKFCLRISSEFQPIGYQKNEPNSKFSLSIRRDAKNEKVNSDKWRDSVLYGSKYAIDLQKVVRNPDIKLGELERVGFGEVDDSKVKENFSKLVNSIRTMLNIEIALIVVPNSLFEPTGEETPPVVQLFQRLGRGGTPLSQADFIYSSIKFEFPDAHRLVMSLCGDEYKTENKASIARLQTPTQLVMCALRLAIAEAQADGQTKTPTDNPVPDVNYFHRLKSSLPNFLEDNFKPMFEGEYKLEKSYESLLCKIKYRDDNKLGLPSQALTLLDEHLVHCLLRWVRVFESEGKQINPEQMIQFILYWALCVKDKPQVSKIFFEVVKSVPENVFESVYKELKDKDKERKFSHLIYSPEQIKQVKNLVFANKTDKPLIGSTRFYKEKDEFKAIRDFYARFWKGSRNSHIHSLLLWLQREYVGVAFSELSPIVNSEEDTPYDYDHLCPSSHWSGWTGNNSKSRILDFMSKEENRECWIVGNGVGNVRVVDSSTNRSDGDTSQGSKLSDTAKSDFLMGLSPEESDNWTNSAATEGKKKEWSKERVTAFQNAVELRTFSLYQKYFDDLGFKALVE